MPNVNNWHWVEKNCLPWSQLYLTPRLVALQCSSDTMTAQITSVKSITGDVDVNVRKGKVIYLFDLEVVMQWSVKIKNGGSEEERVVTGEMTMRDCTFDEEPETYATTVKVDGSPKDENAVKAFVATKLRALVNPIFVQFPVDLVADQGPALLAQSAGVPLAQAPALVTVPSTSNGSAPKVPAPVTTNGNSIKQQSSSDVTKVSVTSTFKASAQDVFDSMMLEDRVAIWTGDKNAHIKSEVGTKFSIMNNTITGEILECTPAKSIKMKWRLSSWPKGHLSEVSIKFDQGSDSTKLELTHTGVPKANEEMVRQSWENVYFNRIKHIFGYAM